EILDVEAAGTARLAAGDQKPLAVGEEARVLAFQVTHRERSGLPGPCRQQQACPWRVGRSRTRRPRQEHGDPPFAIRGKGAARALTETHRRAPVGSAQVGVPRKRRARASSAVPEEERLPIARQRTQDGPLEPGEIVLLALALTGEDETVVPLRGRDEG